ncbi:MAG: UDP-N-acetylglucosamine 4,6-dehydratase (inverting) [Planctomycetes bacterium]|nr:UDP-N-acetylglucosamine 4,6-dehydratase (inverting) [Planctomycetota bacterium]
MLNSPNLDFLDGQVILLTGGTGSLGKTITRILLEVSKAKKIIIFSRDELKQFEMQNQFAEIDTQDRLRYFLGDVRDKERCMMAFKSVDFIIHAAALKQVPAAEYNPFEFIRTNILGAQNVIEASIERNVKQVMALSTDKAANPINLYGATKFCSDKLFVAGNQYSGQQNTRFSVVRYGNVVGSRGSVIPFFLKERNSGVLPVTHKDMTRFWISLEQAANFVLNCKRIMKGQEIFIPKIPSMKIIDLANFMSQGKCKIEEIGIRPGEKMHEVMVPEETSRTTLEFDEFFIIKPSVKMHNIPDYWEKGSMCQEGFQYSSDSNTQWLNNKDVLSEIKNLNLPGTQDFLNSLG